VTCSGDGFSFKAHVDAHDGSVVTSDRQDADFSYRALPITHQNPTKSFEFIVNPENRAASPKGWVTNTTTAGNNAIGTCFITTFLDSLTLSQVYKDNRTGVAIESSPGIFNYTWSASADPTTDPTLSAAKVSAFNAVNTIHDITYLYGFTERAFNFQQDNFGKEGKGGDPVIVTVQGSRLKNNALFTVCFSLGI
jgi:extracellular elastinolytic metalloproteinase